MLILYFQNWQNKFCSYFCIREVLISNLNNFNINNIFGVGKKKSDFFLKKLDTCSNIFL